MSNDDSPYLAEEINKSSNAHETLAQMESKLTEQQTELAQSIDKPNEITDVINGGAKNPQKIVEQIFNKPSECAFDKQQGPVCAPKHVVKSMEEYLKSKGIKVRNHVEAVNKIKDAMNCSSESCVIKNPEFIKFAKLSNVDKILDEFFKPEGPATNFGLLSNFNIDDVLDQFEERFPGFLHIPFQMRDFEKIGTQLAVVDLAKEFRNGKKSFGVVLNTDWSTGGGIHWYCLFGFYDGKQVQLEYFNSSGKEPLPETQAWLLKTKHYLEKQMKVPVKIHYSTGIVFQNDDHSCGVYCLMYLWLRLEGISADWFNSENFGDKVMHKARKILFRTEK